MISLNYRIVTMEIIVPNNFIDRLLDTKKLTDLKSHVHSKEFLV